MITYPNCKINLGLHIVERRSDNYHNIETVFYPIPLCDELEVEKSNVFSFIQDGMELECDPNENLCVKAYKLLKTDFPEMCNVAMRLKKNIPFGAGLGGGSADAAFCLVMLNEVCQLGLNKDELQDYARKLGADCAFFINNIPVFATQKGDVFEPCAVNLEAYNLLIVKPPVFISTPQAYKGVKPQKPNCSLKEVVAQPVDTWRGKLVNDFESSIFVNFPEISHIKDMLYSSGAVYASMSGSGSAFFGIYSKGMEINKQIFDNKGFATFVLDL
jgi:4-diphosphocytidyl-2-C-methyl-D-erythritol kinase